MNKQKICYISWLLDKISNASGRLFSPVIKREVAEWIEIYKKKGNNSSQKQHIRELGIKSFTERLDRILEIWNGQDDVEVTVKVTLMPRVDVEIDELRRIVNEKKE